MLELYHAAVSTCSQRVRMALAEKELAWTSRPVSLQNREHLAESYLRLNPNGVVPTLVHDGLTVADSTVIMEYLEDVFPERPLRPANAHERARMRMWQQYIDEVPTPATRVPSFHLSFGKHLRSLSREALEGYAAARPLRRDFYLRMGPQGFSEEDLAAAMSQLAQACDRAEASLLQTEWLAGERLTIADISLLPAVVRMQDLGFTQFLAERPNLARWYEAISARPSFATAYFPASRTL